MESTSKKLDQLINDRMQKIEKNLVGDLFSEDALEDLSQESVFRIRLIWLLSRCFYESCLYVKAIKKQLNPQSALYGSPSTCLLGDVAKVSVLATKELVPHEKFNK